MLFARAGNEVAAMFTAEDTDSEDYVADFGCLVSMIIIAG